MIREKLGKKFIKIDDDVRETSEETVETKEEKEMGFFAKHKKGLIIGGLGALAAGAVGLLIANKGSDDDFDEAAEKAELYLKEKGFTNYEIQSVFLSSVKPGQLLMITVDGDMHSVAKEYPTYAQIVVQISSWLMSPPHN